jgi:hypothetical protein
VGHSRKSAGTDCSTAGEGADALYLCLLALLFQPRESILHERLGSDWSHVQASGEALDALHSGEAVEPSADAAAASGAPGQVEPLVEEVVMLLLSKLEPSGILDRCHPVCPLTFKPFECLIHEQMACAVVRSLHSHLRRPHHRQPSDVPFIRLLRLPPPALTLLPLRPFIST